LYSILYVICIFRQIAFFLLYIHFRGDKNAFAYSGDLRIDNDIKQGVIAKELNVTQATYSRYETGSIDIPVSTLIRLAGYYHTSVDYLLRTNR